MQLTLTLFFSILECTKPFISTSTVTASSQLSPQYSPEHAALSSQTGWCPKQNFTDEEYLQVCVYFPSLK